MLYLGPTADFSKGLTYDCMFVLNDEVLEEKLHADFFMEHSNRLELLIDTELDHQKTIVMTWIPDQKLTETLTNSGNSQMQQIRSDPQEMIRTNSTMDKLPDNIIYGINLFKRQWGGGICKFCKKFIS